jgi:hypothetical protein
MMSLGRNAFEMQCLVGKATKMILVSAQNGPGAMMTGRRSQLTRNVTESEKARRFPLFGESFHVSVVQEDASSVWRHPHR